MDRLYSVTIGTCIKFAYLLSKKTLHRSKLIASLHCITLLKVKKQFAHHVRDHETR